ncbi:divalent-cation tolerance protein CutA [Pannonibacter sp. Pt2-lr]|uniref:Divalent-cation tolerance protein CutA n=1 Tax=Pannonibacter anstelovis TaxID=3121537 RepID=A0ABU7ZTI0_9HYPH
MLLAVCTTTEAKEEARTIARAAVEAGLAACVHMEEITSLYMWDGKVNEGGEVRLTMKTAAEAYPALEALIQRLHSYDLPAVYAFEVVKGSPAYMEWVREQVPVRE